MYLHFPHATDSCLDRGFLDQFSCFSVGFLGATPWMCPYCVHIQALGSLSLGQLRNCALLDENRKSSMPASAVLHPHPAAGCLCPQKLWKLCCCKLVAQGQEVPLRDCLLPAALGRDAAGLDKNVPFLVCEEPELCLSHLFAGSFLHTSGFFYTITTGVIFCAPYFFFSFKADREMCFPGAQVLKLTVLLGLVTAYYGSSLLHREIQRNVFDPWLEMHSQA